MHHRLFSGFLLGVGICLSVVGCQSIGPKQNGNADVRQQENGLSAEEARKITITQVTEDREPQASSDASTIIAKPPMFEHYGRFHSSDYADLTTKSLSGFEASVSGEAALQTALSNNLDAEARWQRIINQAKVSNNDNARALDVPTLGLTWEDLYKDLAIHLLGFETTRQVLENRDKELEEINIQLGKENKEKSEELEKRKLSSENLGNYLGIELKNRLEIRQTQLKVIEKLFQAWKVYESEQIRRTAQLVKKSAAEFNGTKNEILVDDWHAHKIEKITEGDISIKFNVLDNDALPKSIDTQTAVVHVDDKSIQPKDYKIKIENGVINIAPKPGDTEAPPSIVFEYTLASDNQDDLNKLSVNSARVTIVNGESLELPSLLWGKYRESLKEAGKEAANDWLRSLKKAPKTADSKDQLSPSTRDAEAAERAYEDAQKAIERGADPAAAYALAAAINGGISDDQLQMMDRYIVHLEEKLKALGLDSKPNSDNNPKKHITFSTALAEVQAALDEYRQKFRYQDTYNARENAIYLKVTYPDHEAEKKPAVDHSESFVLPDTLAAQQYSTELTKGLEALLVQEAPSNQDAPSTESTPENNGGTTADNQKNTVALEGGVSTLLGTLPPDVLSILASKSQVDLATIGITDESQVVLIQAAAKQIQHQLKLIADNDQKYKQRVRQLVYERQSALQAVLQENLRHAEVLTQITRAEEVRWNVVSSESNRFFTAWELLYSDEHRKVKSALDDEKNNSGLAVYAAYLNLDPFQDREALRKKLESNDKNPFSIQPFAVDSLTADRYLSASIETVEKSPKEQKAVKQILQNRTKGRYLFSHKEDLKTASDSKPIEEGGKNASNDFDPTTVGIKDPVLSTLRLLSTEAQNAQNGVPKSAQDPQETKYSFEELQYLNDLLRNAVGMINAYLVVTSVNERYGMENILLFRMEAATHRLSLASIGLRFEESDIRFLLNEQAALMAGGVKAEDANALFNLIQAGFLGKVALD
ncbi:MAG: hypothetical protein AAGA25_06720 [Planctomycetota bacterium]